MFRGLRLRLTLLYMLASLLLIVLIGAATYQLTDRYFQSATDGALQHKLATEVRLLGVPLSEELLAADHNWYSTHSVQSGPAPTGTPRVRASDDKEEDNGHKSDAEEHEGPDERELEETFDGDLAAIFVLPLNADGQQLAVQGTGAAAAPMGVDVAALNTALDQGVDWRTVQLSGGTRVRLLTYKLPVNSATGGAAALQLGRTLADRDRVLNQMLLGLFGLSAFSMLLLGAASWWLAGRSLRPAQQAWERQQAFVANASHELRAPLTLMRASTEVAMRTLPASDRDNRELLDDVLQECDHMSRLVEDLLLLSRLDAGRLKIEQTAVSVEEMFGDVSRQVGRVAQQQGIGLTTEPVRDSILADPARLRQVLLILLDNALQYTPAGGSIQLAAHRYGSQMQLSVIDTGPGIAHEHLAHLFERFYRVSDKRSAQAEGSGLGLSIAKGLVEAQHGHIWIESKQGEGTRAIVSLPAQR
ncbi:MAG: ATP-binding protein [Chloroflexota bacterium]